MEDETTAEQTWHAQVVINRYLFLPEHNILQPSLWFLNVPQSIATTDAHVCGRFSVVLPLLLQQGLHQ